MFTRVIQWLFVCILASAAASAQVTVKGDIPSNASVTVGNLTLTYTVLTEGASSPYTAPGVGVLWVKNDVPATIWYTDDAGGDHQLGVGGSGIASTVQYSLQVADAAGGWVEDTAIKSNTGRLTVEGAAAASAPAGYWTGAIYAGGTGTTTFPAVLIQPTGATAATTWDTSGTALGVNLNTAQGMIEDYRVDGAKRWQMNDNGQVTLNVIQGSVIEPIGMYLDFDLTPGDEYTGTSGLVIDAAGMSNGTYGGTITPLAVKNPATVFSVDKLGSVTGNYFNSGASGYLVQGTVAQYSASTFLASTGVMSWSSTSAYSGAKDIGLKRAAAGVLQVTDGASGAGHIKHSGFYGELYENDLGGATVDITVTTAGVYYGWVTATAGELSGTGYVTADVTASGSCTGAVDCDKLILGANGAGVYSVSFGVSFAGTSNALIYGKVYVNQAATDIGFARKLSTGGDVGSAARSGILTLAASDRIGVRFTSDGNGDEISIESLHLTLTRIGS